MFPRDKVTQPLGNPQAHTWPINQLGNPYGEVPILSLSDTDALVELTRVSIFGEVFIRLQWGTGAVWEIDNLRAPFIADLPGRLTVYARPTNEVETTVKVTAAKVKGAGPAVIRQLIVAEQPGPVAIDERAAFFHSLAPSTLTIAGNAVAVAAEGERIPLFPQSSLATGLGAAEFYF